MVLEPLYEQDFLDCSHGFRPGRSPHGALQALQALRQQLMRMGGGWCFRPAEDAKLRQVELPGHASG